MNPQWLPNFETLRVNGALYCVPRAIHEVDARRGTLRWWVVPGFVAMLILPMVPPLIWVAQVSRMGNLEQSRIASWVAVASMFFGPMLLVAWSAFKQRKEPKAEGPFIVPPLFEAPYPGSVSAKIGTHSAIGGSYYGLGWISASEGRLRGVTLEQAFDLARQDIAGVRAAEGRIEVHLKKRPELSQAYVSIRLNLRDGKAERQLRRELIRDIKAMPESSKESIFPAQTETLRLIPGKTVAMSSLWGAGFAGCVVGCMQLGLMVVPDAKVPPWETALMVVTLFAICGPLTLWLINLMMRQTLKERVKWGFQSE